MLRPARPVPRRSLLAAALVVVLAAPTACGPRQVAVRTGESPTAESSIEFTNNLTTAVNVYVRPNTGSGELFLRQVAPGTTETIPVRGVSPGTAVRLRATPVTGNPNYEQDNVTLGKGYVWRVP